MSKIKVIDGDVCDELKRAIGTALQSVEKQFGIIVVLGPMTYTDYRMRFPCKVYTQGGIEKEWGELCNDLGLEPDDYGKTFTDEEDRQIFIIVGVNTSRNTYKIMCRNVESGKIRHYNPDYVKDCLLSSAIEDVDIYDLEQQALQEQDCDFQQLHKQVTLQENGQMKEIPTPSTTVVTRERRFQLDMGDLIRYFAFNGITVSPKATMTITVPTGGDYSGQKLAIGYCGATDDDIVIDVEWTEIKTSNSDQENKIVANTPKKLFTDDEDYTKEGQKLDHEVDHVLLPIFNHWRIRGYSCREIEYLMTRTVEDIASMRLLADQAERAKKKKQ